ncbi:hypothetical protein [Mycobacterium intracellulare]|uniref:hypothetical protein n=1 Tax=Mycobacterium intracellulare TaxID=1767 RepID=UPI0006CA941D|nr:hypothetical protein [Mycobacterium intracellulare]KPN46198.1 hypothetical protein AN933_26580 [Mycobacterium intracellulare subsp. chimaera]
MSTIDYALRYSFVDPADPEVPYRVEFRYKYTPGEHPSIYESNPPGQLFAVVKGGHPDRGTQIPLSRDGVRLNDADRAVDRDNWPWLTPNNIDLSVIRSRIREAGLA